MTQAIAKYAAKKMLAGEMDKYKDRKDKSPYDPYYQMVPHPTKPNKNKKVKKQIPAYIPEHDAEILARARKSAYRLDFCLFNFLGLRFGWSSVIGIIPVIGDAADALLAVRLIRKMKGVNGGLPRRVLGWMIFNLVIDLFIGLVPFVGDLADAYVKCNSRNVRLFEEHLDEMYKPKQLIEEEEKLRKKERPRPATVFEDFSDEEEERRNTFDDRHDVRRPNQAYSGRKQRIPDEEMGYRQGDTHRSERPGRNNTKSSRRH